MVSRETREPQKLLLIDTCGEVAQVGLSRGPEVVRSETIAGRASAAIVGAVTRLLQDEDLRLADLDGVGVVGGPGSFTGVRTGLATAKAFCEVAGIPLASVSRLELLAEAAGLQEGFAVLDAGRGSLYVREIGADGREWLEPVDEFEVRNGGRGVVVAEEKIAVRLAALAPKLVQLRPVHVLELVRRTLASGGTDVAWADANYVVAESDIYARACGPGKAEATAG